MSRAWMVERLCVTQMSFGFFFFVFLIEEADDWCGASERRGDPVAGRVGLGCRMGTHWTGRMEDSNPGARNGARPVEVDIAVFGTGFLGSV